MSIALNKAIRRRLTGQDALTGAGLTAQQRLDTLLAADPNASSVPAVYQGNLASSPVFPCITFRASGGIPSGIGRSEDIGVVGQPEFDFEVWGVAHDHNIDTITEILDLMEQLLDQRRGIVSDRNFFTLDTGWCGLTMECIMDAVIRYDAPQNRWFGLTRYMAIEQRYKQGS